jgi:uncharacterized protein
LNTPVSKHLESLHVNCQVPMMLWHSLAEGMVARKRGGLVLMSSLTAFQGTPFLATYGATKAFNLALAEALHAEFKPQGIDVLAVCAGATTTPNFLRSMPHGAPGQLSPESVVGQALAHLGRGAVVIPGRFNRFVSQLMRRLLPRKTTVRILASQVKRMGP